MSDSEILKPTLFLCWSGWRSKRIAECFKKYFDNLFEKVEEHIRPKVEMSDTLIEKGATWSGQLLENLEKAKAGIICLTPENRDSTWLHFEGGAIVGHGRLDGYIWGIHIWSRCQPI